MASAGGRMPGAEEVDPSGWNNCADRLEPAPAAVDVPKAGFFRLALPWEQPVLGGNGHGRHKGTTRYEP
ncbi:hypothetical protein ACFXPQ_00050 [Streptomyces lydicus]|uniref:hypothetical protein n=1 Tax=Streptomyces lydicus TaxID=47763 RepID=UPI00368E3F95